MPGLVLNHTRSRSDMLGAHAHQTAANKTSTPQQTQERGERERDRERERESARRPKDEWL